MQRFVGFFTSCATKLRPYLRCSQPRLKICQVPHGRPRRRAQLHLLCRSGPSGGPCAKAATTNSYQRYAQEPNCDTQRATGPYRPYTYLRLESTTTLDGPLVMSGASKPFASRRRCSIAWIWFGVCPFWPKACSQSSSASVR